GGIGREIDCHRGAAALRQFAVGRWRDGRPWNVDALLEGAHLVVNLDSRTVSIADIHHAVFRDGHAMHDLHVGWLPLPQKLAGAIHHRDSAVATCAFSACAVYVAVLPVDANARM